MLTVLKESLNEVPIDRVIGGRPYEYVGDGRKGKAIVPGPMKDREKGDIIKRAEKAGYIAKPNMGGGVTIFIESVNEGFYSSPSDLEDSGLNVIPKDQIHANKLQDALEDSGLYGEWNPREGYFFFPEKEDGYDQLEMAIQELMDDYNIQGYIEGVFEESLNENNLLRQTNLSSEEYQKAKKLKGFNADDYTFSSDNNLYVKKSSLEEKKKAKSKKKDPPLNKPKRGGSKAYYVYVRDPKTKKIKKVPFGSGGLRAKIKNKEARNAFAARHNCKNKKDLSLIHI